MSTKNSKRALRTAHLTAVALIVSALPASQWAQGEPPRKNTAKPAPSAEEKQPAAKQSAGKQPAGKRQNREPKTAAVDLEQATFGAGCFWCSEAVFQQLKGVHSVASGYSGGLTKSPTYQEVCSGATGHAEVIQVEFDPKTIAYDELLEVFWQTHDPTTLNQQGADIGTQYRSVVFYHSQEQKKLAEHYKKRLDSEHAFPKPIVTEISEFTEFYPAEAYHQNYYNLHRGEGYCSAVIRPKVAKVKKVFKDKLNDESTKPQSR